MVRIAAAELYGAHHEHGDGGRVRTVPGAERRAPRRWSLLAPARDVAFRQELESATLRDAVGQTRTQLLHTKAFLSHDVSAGSRTRCEVSAPGARHDPGGAH